MAGLIQIQIHTKIETQMQARHTCGRCETHRIWEVAVPAGWLLTMLRRMRPMGWPSRLPTPESISSRIMTGLLLPPALPLLVLPLPSAGSARQ